MAKPVTGPAARPWRSPTLAPCHAKACNEENCHLGLAGFPRRTIISCKEYCKCFGQSGRICDFLLFCEPKSCLHVAAVELKSGTPEIGRALDQLAAGASLVEHLLGDWQPNYFFPVLLHGKGVDPMEYRLFAERKNWIEFRNRRWWVILERCGVEFSAILKKYGPK